LKGDVKSLVAAAQQGGIFLVHVGMSGTDFWVTSIDSVNVGFVPGPSPGDKAKALSGGGDPGFAKPTPNRGEPAATAASFSGSWAANADKVRYAITLSQSGNGVVGNYQGTDGSVGTISGKLNGNVLRFAWVQKDGNRGTGKFVLSDNGQSFDGSYNFGNNPDAVEGRWSGTRQ
jgi:hypothetical protein